MKLYGKVFKTPLMQAMNDWPYRGNIYNEQGTIIDTEAVGMDEESCKQNIRHIAEKIRRQSFLDDKRFFEV